MMHRALVVIVLVAGLRAQEPPAPTDHCAPYDSCQTCVKENLCGWCSLPVVYPNNVTGPQCAGFNPKNHSHPFSCNGIYSIDQCVQGYFCNKINYTCQMAPAGQGVSHKQCEADCYSHGHVYLCNQTKKQCYQVPPGTKGASSYSVCMASCEHASPHPAPPPPPPTPAQTYTCNYTTGQCVTTTPGHGSSKSVCEQTCQKGNATKFLCNKFLQKCYQVPPDTPGAHSKAECETQCNPKPNPGPPPIFLGGLWRGIEIQNNYKIGEWDMEFNKTTAKLENIAAGTTIIGTPYNIQDGDRTDIIIDITSGPGVGHKIRGFAIQNNQGPETNFITAAFSAPGGRVPISINSAMTDGTSLVFALSQCISGTPCIFTFPDGNQQQHRRRRSAKALQLDMDTELMTMKKLKGMATDDRCSKYSANCSECLSHEFCGWCSTDVIYKDGSKGTQCAGFSNNPNQTTPWQCSGRYSTFSCTTGYDCDNSTYQCVPDPVPGNGLPLGECEQLCRPTHTPIPVPEQYVCNLTTHQCFKCNETHCPGSMPKGVCESSCVHPKPGPSKLVKGIWRGIGIQNGYTAGEYEYAFNASSVSVYFNDQLQWAGTIESFGGDVMFFTITEGFNSGATISAAYSIQDQGGLYSQMTIAFGKVNGRVPTTYDEAMTTSGMYEQVLSRCNSKPCSFHHP